MPGPGLAFPGPHQAAIGVRPRASREDETQGRRLRGCSDTSLSGTPGGRFTEVEVVTSEFLQTYKIHISVHVFGAVSSQAEGGN